MSILTKNEANKTIKRMMAVFTFHNLGDDGVKVEWMKSLGSLDFRKCDKLIDRYKKTESKSLPPISSFLQEYWKSGNQSHEGEICDCSYCKAKGYLTYQKPYDYKDKTLLSQPYIAYCDCASGEQYKYDGTQLEDHKSQYYIPSAAKLNLVEENIKFQVLMK